MTRVLFGVIAFAVVPLSLLHAAADFLVLPKPDVPTPGSLEDTLNRVRTEREYSAQPLLLPQLASVLWAGGGNRYDAMSGASSRTYPSAGNIYPVRVYVVAGVVEGLKPGIYQYLPTEHVLKILKPGDHRRELVEGSGQAGFAALAPATVVLAADYGWTTTAFGERGKNLYVPLDAGHVSQSLRLAATAVGLAVGMAGQFDHAQVQDLLGITDEPLLILTLGHHR